MRDFQALLVDLIVIFRRPFWHWSDRCPISFKELWNEPKFPVRKYKKSPNSNHFGYHPLKKTKCWITIICCKWPDFLKFSRPSIFVYIGAGVKIKCIDRLYFVHPQKKFRNLEKIVNTYINESITRNNWFRP